MHRFLTDAIFALLGVLACIGGFLLHEAGLLGDTEARVGFGIVDGKLGFSIQWVSWVVFFIGLGELAQRMVAMRGERRALRSGLLPPGHNEIFRQSDLGDVYRLANSLPQHLIFPRTVKRIVSSFQISRSVAHCSAMLQATLDTLGTELELRYSFLRYLLWLLPSLGFIGTVWGIGQGLQVISVNPPTVENAQQTMKEVTAVLSVAFDTTLIALLLTSVLAYLIYLAETEEEHIVNTAGQRCMDDLVNQLIEET